MGWKKWPAWLKGGIVGFIVDVVLFLTVTVFWFVIIDINTSFQAIYGESFSILFGIFFLFFSIPIILVGALIGWIVGRTKNK